MVFVAVPFLALVVLKLAGAITWPWLTIVAAPVLLVAGVVCLSLLGLLLMAPPEDV